MHTAILLVNLAFTFNTLGHCPMALQYYTLKEIKKKLVNTILNVYSHHNNVTTKIVEILAKHLQRS